MAEGEYQSTIYDDVWRTLVHDFPNLLVYFVNELFGERYTSSDRVEFLQDVHEQNSPEGTIEKHTTDSYFRIVTEDGRSKTYHIECQSKADSSMLLRMFEYGAQIALDAASRNDEEILLEFPNAAVLFLRSTENTPDNMKIRLRTPGGEISYDVPVAKMRNYTVESMLEKRLLILLPFFMFIVEHSLKEYEANAEKRQELVEALKDIMQGLAKMQDAGEIDVLTQRSLIELTDKVNYHLARRYGTVQKEAKNIMGGKVLEYSVKTSYRKGVAEGEARGAERMIVNMLKGKMSLQQVADIAQMTVAQVAEIGKKAMVL